MSSQPLSVNNVKKTFKMGQKTLTALNDVSLRIAEGKIHGLLGPNGAGKSTLINIISSVLRPDEGTVSVFGVDAVKDPNHAKQLLGVVPQEIVVEMAFTVYEVLYYFSGMYGVPAHERKPRIMALLEELQLADKANERAKNLSGGMKRRLMIAKALVHRPKLVILDEPTAGVDVALRQKIWQLIRRINKEDGTSILFTTHYLEEAEQLCESITLINHGAIIKEGRLKDIQQEFSKNVIHFELFDRNVPHLPHIREVGVEYELPMTDLSADMQRLTSHYRDNLKSLRNEAASLEQIFLELTQNV